MTSKQFCKLQEEFKDRNVDPYELQVFQEQYSLNLKDNKQPKLFDEVSVATSNQYKGLKNQKFIFDLGRHSWINSETKRAVELAKSSEVGPGGNIETSKLVDGSIRQTWHVNPCGGAEITTE